MLIPCIDLQDGQAVQLVHGRKRELAVADVFGLLKKFKKYPWLHVIDLDAAMGKGQNDDLVRMVYQNCNLAHLESCHTIHDGRYYMCSPAVWTQPRLARRVD